jgi:hypothetical protein
MIKHIVFTVFAVLFTACCACRNGQTDTVSTEPIIIQLGSGGGFTGRMSGLEIDKDGVVTTWSAMPGEDHKPERIGVVPDDYLETLYEIADEDELLTFDYTVTGNMTTSLTLIRGNERNNMRWPGIEMDIEAPPRPLQRFHTQLKHAIDSIVKDKKENDK